MKTVFLSEACLCHCAVLIALHTLCHCILTHNPTLKDKNCYSHLTSVEREPGAAEELVQGHKVCKWHAVTQTQAVLLQ